MPYQIGDRRFPELADFYDDPQGHQPREVSQTPVQVVHVLNSFGTDTILAYSYATINPAPVAPGTIGPDFVFEDGRTWAVNPTPNLDSSYSWRVVRLGCSVSTFPVRVGFVPNVTKLNKTVAGGGDAIFNEYPVQATAYVQHRAEWDDFVAPYGGYFWFTGVGGNSLVTLRVVVVGSLRSTLT